MKIKCGHLNSVQNCHDLRCANSLAAAHKINIIRAATAIYSGNNLVADQRIKTIIRAPTAM